MDDDQKITRRRREQWVRDSLGVVVNVNLVDLKQSRASELTEDLIKQRKAIISADTDAEFLNACRGFMHSLFDVAIALGTELERVKCPPPRTAKATAKRKTRSLKELARIAEATKPYRHLKQSAAAEQVTHKLGLSVSTLRRRLEDHFPDEFWKDSEAGFIA